MTWTLNTQLGCFMNTTLGSGIHLLCCHIFSSADFKQKLNSVPLSKPRDRL